MYQRILLPLDGSTDEAQIVQLVKAFAANMHSTVILYRVLKPVRELLFHQVVEVGIDEQMAILRKQAIEALDPAKCELAGSGIPVELAVDFGQPAAAILDYAERERVDLIAMATHGRAGLARLVYGSVTDAVLRHGHIPLLVMRTRETPSAKAPRLSRILVPLDGSTLAACALPHAQQLAMAHKADVVLFAIWDTFGHSLTMYPQTEIEAQMLETHAVAKQYLIAQADALQARGVCVRWQLQSGLVVESIVATAEQQAVSLIVMSTHGRRGFNLWLAGSVADEVLRATDIPVLLIRDPKAGTCLPPAAGRERVGAP